MNSACLLVGSNIEAVENTQKAMQMLRAMVEITAVSRTWEIPSMGSPGPNYINFALEIRTPLAAIELKQQVIGKIETALDRVRNRDKNAPRTIDIDIIVYNQELMDVEIWNRPYVALPVSDILPDLRRPHDNIHLHEIAQQILSEINATIRKDLSFQQV